MQTGWSAKILCDVCLQLTLYQRHTPCIGQDQYRLLDYEPIREQSWPIGK
jgi:hypothetical protein